ncbi:MAG: hypothetical protein RIS36_1471 [Pseudomonadota bacterium]|jgi:hypothetical protein
MAVCLQYQSVYVKREATRVSGKLQLVGAVVLLALLGSKVWAKLEATDLGYSLARERQKTVALDMERRELELQRSVLMRPDSLSRAARDKVGLAENSLGQTLKVTY